MSKVTEAPTPPPPAVRDLAEGCVKFVERALGTRLDYEPETLPLLDHYIEQGRAHAVEKPETVSLLAHTSGAYLGEVIRRRHACWWRIDGDDPLGWRLEFETVYLSFSPMQLVFEALTRHDAGDRLEGGLDEEPSGTAHFELEEEDRKAVAARLADLPGVTEEEFYAPSTRLEVIDILIEALRARRLAEGDESEARLTPEDYDP